MASLFFLMGLSDAQLDRLGDAHLEFIEEFLELASTTKKKKGFLASLVSSGDAAEADEREPNGILMEQRFFSRALDVLGATEVARENLGQDIQLVTLAFDRAPAPVVAVHLWDSKTSPSTFVKIIEEVLLPHVDTDIIVHYAGSNMYRSVENDGLFHIHIFSTPKDGVGLTHTEITELWGYPIQVRTDRYPMHCEKRSIRDTLGTSVGAVENNRNVYTYYDLVRLSENDGGMFRCFIESLYRHCFLDEEERLQLEEAARKERLARQRESYVALCQIRIDSEVHAVRKRLNESESELAQLWAQYLAKQKQVEEQQMLLEKLELDAPELREKLIAEFEQFFSNKKILRVVPSGDQLSVYTRVLYLLYRGKVYEVGEMRIDLLLSDRDKGNPVRIFNMSRMRDPRGPREHHPHVDSAGNPCYGNSLNLFSQFVRQRELYAATAYAIQYIESTQHSPDECRELGRTEILELREQGLLPAGA